MIKIKGTRRLKIIRGRLMSGGSMLAMVTAILSTGVASAQTSESADTPAAQVRSSPNSVSSASSSDLDEVVVTAQKRSERLEDVPISISVVSPAVLEQTNARNFSELSGAVPGIMFNGNGGGGRTYLSLRGTTGSALNTGDEPVAIYLDDVYIARGVTVNAQDLLDVDSIEVVRGPQGTLQGRNATAGAILMHSADPTSALEGYVKGELENPLEFRTQAAISGPLGGGFEGRLAVGYVNAQGWAKNLYDGTNIGGDRSAQIRGTLKYSDESPFTARVAIDYSSTTNTPALFRGAATTFNKSPTGQLVTAPTPLVPLTAAQHSAIYDDNDYDADPGTHTTVNTDGLSAKLAYAFADMDLISVTGYRRLRTFGTNNSSGLNAGARMGFNTNDDRSSEVSQEVRLQSSGDKRLSWILGLYYFNEDQDYADTIFNLDFSAPTSTASFYFGNQTTNAYAAFADSTFNLLDNLQLIGGVRFTEDTKQLTGGVAVTNFGTGAVARTPYVPPSDTWVNTNFRTKLVYHPLPNLMLFAGYGTGFRAGGYNDFAVQAPFNPEKNRSYEVGTKGDLFDRKLSFSLSAYHNLYSNLQLRAGVPTGGAIITNAADSEINGFEFELNARPFQHTRLTGNVSNADATFTSFPRAVDIFNNFVDASGNELPNAPRWQYFLSAEQEFPLSNDWLLTAGLNYRWRDTIYYYFTNQNAATLRDGPGGTLNGRLSLTSDNAAWTVAAFATNLTNTRMVNTDVITFSYPELSLIEPREVGVSVEWRF